MSEGLHPEQIKALRKMTPANGSQFALGFIEEMRQLKASALRRQHPDWAEAHIAQALHDFILHADS